MSDLCKLALIIFTSLLLDIAASLAFNMAVQAAIHTDNPSLNATPQADKPSPEKPLCFDAVTHTLILVYKDGHKELAGRFTVWDVCK